MKNNQITRNKFYCSKCGKQLKPSSEVYFYSQLSGKPNRKFECPGHPDHGAVAEKFLLALVGKTL